MSQPIMVKDIVFYHHSMNVSTNPCLFYRKMIYKHSRVQPTIRDGNVATIARTPIYLGCRLQLSQAVYRFRVYAFVSIHPYVLPMFDRTQH